MDLHFGFQNVRGSNAILTYVEDLVAFPKGRETVRRVDDLAHLIMLSFGDEIHGTQCLCL